MSTTEDPTYVCAICGQGALRWWFPDAIGLYRLECPTHGYKWCEHGNHIMHYEDGNWCDPSDVEFVTRREWKCRQGDHEWLPWGECQFCFTRSSNYVTTSFYPHWHGDRRCEELIEEKTEGFFCTKTGEAVRVTSYRSHRHGWELCEGLVEEKPGNIFVCVKTGEEVR